MESKLQAVDVWGGKCEGSGLGLCLTGAGTASPVWEAGASGRRIGQGGGAPSLSAALSMVS